MTYHLLPYEISNGHLHGTDAASHRPPKCGALPGEKCQLTPLLAAQ